MQTIRDGAVVVNLHNVFHDADKARSDVYVLSATYRGIDVPITDGHWVYLNIPEGTVFETMVGDTVRHLAGAS